MNKDLRQFLQVAKERGPDYYVEVKKPLKPYLEPCIIQEKLAAEGRYPIVYCPKIEGSEIPLVTGLFGKYELLALGIGCDPDTQSRDEVDNEVRRRIAGLSSTNRWLPQDSRPWEPRWVPASAAPVKEVVMKGNDVDLNIFPIVHHASLDCGKYVTVAFTVSKWPDGGGINVGTYRQMLRGKNRLGCMMNPSNDGAYIARRCAELGKPMEVAVVVGHHSAVLQGAWSRAPEMNIMGALLGEPLEITKAETVDLPVPACAEVVIEGVIDPRRMETDGPFGEITGYYGHEGKPCYVIEVTAVTMRRNPIWHDLDPAHKEHGFGRSLVGHVVRLDAIRDVVPSVTAVAAGTMGTYIALRQHVPGEGRKAGLFAAVTGGAVTVVVDDDVDVHNEKEVLFAIQSRVRWDEDVTVLSDVLGAHLHPMSYNESRTGGWRSPTERGPMNSKIVIDATRPVEREFETRVTADPALWKAMDLRDYLGDQPARNGRRRRAPAATNHDVVRGSEVYRPG